MGTGVYGSVCCNDESIKKRVNPGSGSRREGVYDASSNMGEVADGQELMKRGFYSPESSQIKEYWPRVQELLASGAVHVIIPMYEEGGEPHYVPREVLQHLTDSCCMPRESILVVNHLSGEQAVTEAERYGVRVVDAMEVIDCLSPAINSITGLSRLYKGKGVACLAGYLAEWAYLEKNQCDNVHWLFQHDSELCEVEAYNPLSHLLHPLIVGEGRYNHIKMAKWGRGNEAVMAARNTLMALEKSPVISRQTRELARVVRLETLRHKWMLTGEFGISLDEAFKRPFAVGFLEETLTSLHFAVKNHGGEFDVAQVANRYPRLDAANDARREQLMMNRLCQALVALVLFGKPSHQWDLEDFRQLNHDHLALLDQATWIPENENPVTLEGVQADRVIPSVEQLLEYDLVNIKGLREMID